MPPLPQNIFKDAQKLLINPEMWWFHFNCFGTLDHHLEGPVVWCLSNLAGWTCNFNLILIRLLVVCKTMLWKPGNSFSIHKTTLCVGALQTLILLKLLFVVLTICSRIGWHKSFVKRYCSGVWQEAGKVWEVKDVNSPYSATNKAQGCEISNLLKTQK